MNVKNRRRRRKRRSRLFRLTTVTSLCMLMAVIIGIMLLSAIKHFREGSYGFAYYTIAPPPITENLLTPNPYSRSEEPLKKVKGIVIHYTANPGTSAEANRNYFENLKSQRETSASSHFIIGLEGEILQCIPLDEISFASNDRNVDTISIECCHPDATGKFNEKTYASLVALSAWLCSKYRLDEKDILRHYDITGKLCPLYYVKHEDAWNTLKENIFTYLKEKEASAELG
ncbi:peptidoglycan recognition protein family protein [Anaerocolumna xylanovorans]|uniref:N-acetylmuramoyl-L-alanine amidase n=1 Tax=Anaerocolumna xylanovorans DSM 12503 TaxID=1121345 RepID=A0A1M7YHP0_9FIRM|nr:peptidoglycan recognition family protein [Anaerocolumna xylanovorans]SHO52106.1 N-acetylmuramoyl-L-alanine amidase [Anaerocolumna xylanovorans DSM 12503]